MVLYYGVVRCDGTSHNRQVVFESPLVVEAAYHVSRLNDTAPREVRYQLVRLPVRKARM
jgi:hypothetical protein